MRIKGNKFSYVAVDLKIMDQFCVRQSGGFSLGRNRTPPPRAKQREEKVNYVCVVEQKG